MPAPQRICDPGSRADHAPSPPPRAGKGPSRKPRPPPCLPKWPGNPPSPAPTDLGVRGTGPGRAASHLFHRLTYQQQRCSDSRLARGTGPVLAQMTAACAGLYRSALAAFEGTAHACLSRAACSQPGKMEGGRINPPPRSYARAWSGFVLPAQALSHILLWRVGFSTAAIAGSRRHGRGARGTYPGFQ